MVDPIKKYDPIKAEFLNELVEGVNSLDKAIEPPRQTDKPPSQEVTQENPDFVPKSAYSETERTTSTVQVFDQNNENYAEIERIEAITFLNGYGEEIKLVFNN